MRSTGYSYTRYVNGERELYNLWRRAPQQLTGFLHANLNAIGGSRRTPVC